MNSHQRLKHTNITICPWKRISKMHWNKERQNRTSVKHSSFEYPRSFNLAITLHHLKLCWVKERDWKKTHGLGYASALKSWRKRVHWRVTTLTTNKSILVRLTTQLLFSACCVGGKWSSYPKKIVFPSGDTR